MFLKLEDGNNINMVSSETREFAELLRNAIQHGLMVEIRVEDKACSFFDMIINTKILSVGIDEEQKQLRFITENANFVVEDYSFFEGTSSHMHDKLYVKNKEISVTITVRYS